MRSIEKKKESYSFYKFSIVLVKNTELLRKQFTYREGLQRLHNVERGKMTKNQ